MIPSIKGRKDNVGIETRVIPVGSSWIICDSKSRPGFKYYFNTESGEAVWNLNNKDQMEKAKKHTQILHTRLGIVPELPEPQDRPPMNGQMPMSNFCNYLNTRASSFNGNVWANPPGVVQQPQIVLVPAVAPMLNPSIGNNNLHPTLALQNAFTYQHIGDYNVPYNSNSRKVFNNYKYRGGMSYKNKHFQRHQVQNSMNYKRDGGDLRQKLARKRTHSESNPSYLPAYTEEHFNSNSNESEDNSLTNESCKPEFPGFKATEEIENKSTTDTFQLDNCYVVVDKDTILSEFVFFDNLVSNDPKFRLVVPHHVMSELKTHACKSGEARVRRIVRFLSQKIESRLVYLGEEIEENSLQNWDKTFITCEKLVENYENNVILISKKEETKKFKRNNDKIKVMSMCQFKDTLSNAKARFLSPISAIKIIIPNNLKTDEKLKTNANDCISEETDVERKATNVERNVTNVERNVTNVERNVTNVERNITNVERKVANVERNVTNVERNATNVERNVTNVERNFTNVERKAANVERNVTNVERNVTNVERNVTNVERNITNVERKAANVERNVTNVERNATNVERNVTNVETKDTSSHFILSPSSKQTVDTAVQTEIDTEVKKIRCILSDTNIEVDTTRRNENTTKKREIRLKRTTPIKKPRIEETSSDKKQFKWRKNRATSCNNNNSKRTQSTSNVSTETTNIASKTTVNAETAIISNIPESSFAIPKTNSVMSSISDREQGKMTPNFVAEKDTKIHKDIFRKTSTESWIESLPNSKSDIDKDSKSSSRRSVNKTISSTSTLAHNVNSVVHKVPVKPVNKNIVLKNIEIIPIASPSMEEVLRIRSDEWVSRFVQIMEEILKEKLQENPPFENDEYPPPWNLYEAAKCIIKKYSDYFNVVNAANKLSFILYKISDEKDKIPLTLQPSEFMEMYSYGIYLVETLQDVSSNCDELLAAKESLKTLLYDIQNANTENSCSDIFGDGLHESCVENTTSTDNMESDFRPGQEQSTPKKNPRNRRATRTNTNKKLYNFRSSKKTSEVPEVSHSISSSLDKKTSFLSNLKLITRSISSPSTITSPTYSNLTVRSPINSSVKSPLPVATKLIDNNENDTSKNSEPLKNNEEIVSSSGQPSFVRNFQVCPEFEARINKARSILELNDYDEPYSDDDDDCDDDEFHFNMSQPNCVPKNNTLKDVPVHFVDNSNKEEFHKFRWSFKDPQLRNIKETFADVIDNLSLTTSDPSRIEESKSVAIKLFPCIENIYNSLDNILKKNAFYADANIKEILKNVNADSTEEEMFCLQYRNTITQFRDQAYIIIKYLKVILLSTS